MTTPAISMTEVVIDWITGLGWDDMQELGWPLFDGTFIDIEPDRAVFITLTGGPGAVTDEGSPDAWTFQARVRGTTEDPYGALLAAQRLDVLIRAAPFPASVDGVPVNHVHRAGGPPAPLPVDPADLRREYTCNYLFIAGA